MRILAIKHKDQDHFGLIETVAGPGDELVGVSIESQPLPVSLDGYDALIVMGGPQAAYTDTDFPTRPAELALLREAVDRDLPVLGICLGGQLLAVALGGEAYARRTRGMDPERGYFPVTLTDAGSSDELFADCPATFTPRHFHQDSFDLPPGTVRLASSERCEEQGYRLIGRPVWGVQFHFEMRVHTNRVDDAVIEDSSPQKNYEDDEVDAIRALAPVAEQMAMNFRTALLAHTARVR